MADNPLLHPDKDELVAFGLGKLEPDQATRIETHLEECKTCCDTLLDLEDDTFVELVRKSPAPKQPTDKANTAEMMLAESGVSRGPIDLPAQLEDHPRYRIIELIGKGGMGDVYKAEHRLMDRPVALKLINQDLVKNKQAVERFRREVRAAARLTHPNIVTAHDAEQAGDVHFLVMEFVNGVDLASEVQNRGALPIAEACDYIRQAAEGLQHAHTKGMVHRDIKPHNLMLSADGQVRILDFGLASFATESAMIDADTKDITEEMPTRLHLTTLGSVMGTPDYIAPEQARDAHSADIRADIYSLGCTLCYLLTGEAPFAAASVVDKLKAHAEHEPPALQGLREDAPAELADVVTRMMAKNPDDRFQTPAEVAQALSPYAVVQLAAEATPAAQASPQRSRVVSRSIAAILLLVLLVVFGAVITVATDRGWVVIQSEVNDVKVAVLEGGKQIDVIDVKTGSQVKWMPTGNYELRLMGDDNGVKIDNHSFQMTRLGTVIVTARWNSEGRGAIRSFTTADQPITRDGVTVEDGGWKITAADTRTVRLFEVPMPEMKKGPYFYRAKLKSENVKGLAYLEMWSRFPGEGEFFSKGFDKALQGTNGWAENEVPFFLKEGQQPDLVKLNLTIEGGGTVWIKDVELRGRTISMAKDGTARLEQSNDQRKQVAVTVAREWVELADAGRFGECWETCAAFAKTQITKEQTIELYNGIRKPLGTPQRRTLLSANSFQRLPGAPPGEYIVVQFDTDFSATGKQLEQVTLFWDEDQSWRIAGYHVSPIQQQHDPVTEQKKQAAQSATLDWLKLVDARKYGEAWDATAQINKDGISKQKMVDAYNELFKPLGPMKSRDLKTAEYKTQLPRAPVGEYAVIQFGTQFTNQRVIETVVLTLEADGQWRVSGYFHAEDNSPLTPPPRAGLLTNPPKLPPSGVPVGKNLIVDPSLEETPTGELPQGWFAWLDDGPEFKCEVFEGGVTGKHCLQISGTGTRGVVFATSIPMDRTKRYALKGKVKVEGDAGTWAVIKLNYFNRSGWLGVDDRVGVTSDESDWQFFEKTDRANAFPEATLIVPTCHIEGNGTAWFDDLEVIAYDRDKLPEDFDKQHGKNNRMYSLE